MSNNGSKNGKSKELSNISSGYLLMYNVAMTAGWAALGIGITSHLWKHRTYKGMYHQVQRQFLFFQTCAILEILHIVMGLVRSSVVLTTIQVFSRIGLLWFVVEPVIEVQNSYSVCMFMLAWTITEMVRYSFYTFHLLGSTPYIITWLRYSLFIVLYPLGVMGELLTIYNALPFVKSRDIYSYPLPNLLNLSVDYHTVLIMLYPIYFMGFPQLYFHMLAQRRKTLRAPTSDKKSD